MSERTYSTCPVCGSLAWFCDVVDGGTEEGCAACGAQMWTLDGGRLDLGLIRAEPSEIRIIPEA